MSDKLKECYLFLNRENYAELCGGGKTVNSRALGRGHRRGAGSSSERLEKTSDDIEMKFLKTFKLKK